MTETLARRALLGAAALFATPHLARAQAWPTRPIRWIVNFPPGGAADILSRALGEWFGNRLGQPIVIENRPGAGGMVGADIVAKARGDAHVVMMSSAASHGIGPVLYANVPYDPFADFTHIHSVGSFPSVLLVGADVPASNVAELIALARARPGQITYGSGGNGTMNHLIGQLFARAAGIEFTHVPYRGSAPAMADLMGRQIPALMESVPTALGNIRGGRMRPLATSEAERSSALPEVPTFAEAGFPAATSTNWFGFSAAAGIPPEIAARWEREIAAALASPQVRERFASIGVRPGNLDAAGYTALIRGELARWREVILAGNIRVE
ncbi:Bug family tripartite tricarboxylate transporter substrate binding protein [Falsiroseomonas sp.]|uniref:Bug family tripartite tricarboxylate transporter substrate binding protein n=1 Tax=Falsiroseomonas sp. TaxID=2870721 RepID=UPI0035654064